MDYDPHHRIVNAWLDARLQDDFLEARTLKYVVVLEALCGLVKARHDDIPSGRVPREQWKSTGTKFLPEIKSHLLGTAPNVDAAIVEDICSLNGWGNMNRASFKATLAECLNKLGVSMHGGPIRISRVTAIRNKIVHNLNYLTDDDFKEMNWPPIRPAQQHFFVACFVDELLLRLFGMGDSWRLSTTGRC